jgi:hypothetical protein
VAEADQGSEQRQRRRVHLLRRLPFAGLALTALAVAAGVSLARVRVLALDLAIACLATAVWNLTGRAQRRRARQQRRAEVPRGVRLRQPLWTKLDFLGVGLWVAGLAAALPASVGLTSVSVGVLLTVSAISIATTFSKTLMSPADLTFEEAGLRMHLGTVSFLVPWKAIARVEAVGPDHHRVVNLHIADRAALVASTVPATAAARQGVEAVLSTRKGAGVSLLMMPWTAGLDGVVLERAIEAERQPEPQRGGALN